MRLAITRNSRKADLLVLNIFPLKNEETDGAGIPLSRPDTFSTAKRGLELANRAYFIDVTQQTSRNRPNR
jgi:hypothetical protein